MAKYKQRKKKLADTGSEYHTIVSQAIADAAAYIDEDVAPQREAMQEYYDGEPLGNEEEGRSQIVLTEVRDVIQTILPSLLRVFCSHDNAVEYLPNHALKIEEADQATDYVNYIIHVENPGFTIFFSAFKDALLKKTGIIKWYTEDKTEIFEEDYTGLTQLQIDVLEAEGDVEILSAEPEEPQESIDAPDPESEEAEPTFAVRIRRELTKTRFVVECVPPEEYLVSRDARDDIDRATLVAHRREVTRSDLVAMGYDPEDFEEHFGAGGDPMPTNNERQARNPALRSDTLGDSLDESMDKTLYTEAYMLIDGDEDGIAERRKICTVGDTHHILSDQIWSEMVPFAIFCPDPVPHKHIGRSTADDIADLQKIKTSVVRNTLDSLAQSIFPRTAVVQGAVNMDDVLNTEIGGVVRMKMPGAVQPLATPFVGQQAMPVLAYMDEIRANRSGISKATQGLDPEMLQSTTKDAVTHVTAAAEQRIEMVTRIFAETGMRRLFRGLLRMVVRNQDRAKMVKLRGKFVEVDPRAWDADMAVTVNVGLGMGNTHEKMQILSQVAAKQEQIIMQTGEMNPLCSILELRNTYADMVSLARMKDPSRYFREITAEEVQAYSEQQREGQEKNDPAQILAQVEMMKAQAETQSRAMKYQLDYMKARQDDDRKRDEMFQNLLMRVAEIEARYGAQVDVARIRQEQERPRDEFDAALKQQTPGGM